MVVVARSDAVMAETRYVITGTLVRGQRFKPIHTNTPQHYNIWRGTVWEKQPDGTRKLMYRIWN